MTTAEGIVHGARAGTIEVRTWSLVALVVFVLSLVVYAGFTTVGGIWFTISDALALAAAVMPVVIGLDTLTRPVVGNISWTVRDRAGMFGPRPTRVTYLVGAGFVIGALGSPMGPDSPLVMVAMTLAFIEFIAWVVMLRREMAEAR